MQRIKSCRRRLHHTEKLTSALTHCRLIMGAAAERGRPPSLPIPEASGRRTKADFFGGGGEGGCPRLISAVSQCLAANRSDQSVLGRQIVSTTRSGDAELRSPRQKPTGMPYVIRSKALSPYANGERQHIRRTLGAAHSVINRKFLAHRVRGGSAKLVAIPQVKAPLDN